MKKTFVQPIWKLCSAFCLIFFMTQVVLLNAQTPCNNNGLACPEFKGPKNVSGSLVKSYNQAKCGLGYTTASVRLGQRFSPPGSAQPASFIITGIPLGAIIEKAFLWSGTSGNGDPVTATVQNPTSSSSSFPMTLIASGPNKCWGYPGSHSYRADVTSIISGNGTYLISGLPTGTLNDTDGATLFIIYIDPSATYTGTISISDGSIVVNGGSVLASTSVSYTAPGTTPIFATAFSVMADIQAPYAFFDHSGVNAPYSSLNNWWTYSQSAPTITLGQTTSNFSWTGTGDCVNWIMAGVYFRTQSSDCSKFCCPGQNLVVNGDFEGGNVGVNTLDYSYNSSVAIGATLPGQYNIVNGGEATTINKCWVAQDPSTCTNTSGKFLAVNGRTCGGKKVVWEQSFTVNDWTCYEFCASVKNLKKCECDFDVIPNIEVQFSMPVGNITQIVNATPGACGWIDIKKQICLWGYGSSLTIKILLDESIPGDGNDLGLDNIALIAIPNCPPPIFSITTGPFFPTYYNITATNTPTTACPATYWEVCEYNGSSCITVPMSTVTNPPAWWFASTNFPGYNGITPYIPQPLLGMPQGQFAYGKLYRITLGTWGDCNGWGASIQYVGYSLRTQKMKIFTEEEVKKNPQAVLKALK